MASVLSCFSVTWLLMCMVLMWRSMASLAISDDDEVLDIPVHQVQNRQEDYDLCLLGKLLTDRPINFGALTHYA